MFDVEFDRPRLIWHRGARQIWTTTKGAPDMTPAHPPQPSIRRRRLGSQLRRLREDAGKTVEEAAAFLEVHKATVSRVELGQTGIRPRDIGPLLAFYGVTDPDAVVALEALARDSRKRGWWQQYAETLPPEYADLIALEVEASQIRTFQIALIPGLLQTEGYTRAVTRANPAILDDASLDAFTKVRLARQEVLTAPNPARLSAIIGEAALRTPIGGRTVMRGQLEHLLSVAGRQNASLQVLPFEVGAHAGLSGPFVIFSYPLPAAGDVIYLENLTSSLYLDDPEDAERYRTVFDNLRSAALNPGDSRRMMRDIWEGMKGSS
ncbi:helix-turn-helix domain-containing protein [Kitasatospora sp. NBC_01287]|uniref:helix-turn-helix domain-containing protein n=1 Tax=Kitasatospora sp. NBC_01287 TaxID=2903573 RepID=UPI00224F80DB|nr:helix-turn-helix transcriptional regulator [Kitasatospora sp. NBC_01287]MCX4749956.1 helix-turn-helix domain-containing protein [Kitasatospora sp. NBC_01287]